MAQPNNTISFVDQDSGDEGFFGVRVEGASVGIALSLKTNGDVEAFVGRREIDALIDALQRAKEELSHH